MKKTILLILIVCGGYGLLSGQSIERYVISSMGGSYYNGSDLRIDFTAGESVITTLSATSNMLTQGFQQPYNDGQSTVQEYPGSEFQATLFPNPVVDQLQVIIEHAGTSECRIFLYDLLGRMVAQSDFVPGADGHAEVTLDLSHLATAQYYIRIMQDSRLMETAKLIKISQ